MKIRFWTDFVCPYCFIAEKEFEKLLQERGLEDQVELIPMSFELNPDMPKNSQEGYLAYWAKEEGISLEEAKERFSSAANFAKELGITINIEEQKRCNTNDAHCLYHFAKEKGKAWAFYLHVQEAYFVHGAVIDDPRTLVDLAEEVGISREDSLEIINSEQFADVVKREHEAAIAKEIEYVPHFVFPSGRVAEGVLVKEKLAKALDEELSGLEA